MRRRSAPGLKGNNKVVGHILSNCCIEGKEKLARLARNGIVEIDTNIVAGIERHKPTIGKTDIQSGRDLRLIAAASAATLRASSLRSASLNASMSSARAACGKATCRMMAKLGFGE